MEKVQVVEFCRIWSIFLNVWQTFLDWIFDMPHITWLCPCNATHKLSVLFFLSILLLLTLLTINPLKNFTMKPRLLWLRNWKIFPKIQRYCLFVIVLALIHRGTEALHYYTVHAALRDLTFLDKRFVVWEGRGSDLMISALNSGSTDPGWR